MNHVSFELGRNRRASVTDCKDGVAILTFYADSGNVSCSLHLSAANLRKIAETCAAMAEHMDPGDSQAAHEPEPDPSDPTELPF